MLPTVTNLYDGAATGSVEEIATLFQAGGVRVEHIVSHGQASPADFWYDQDEAEWVLLLCGSAVLAFAPGGELALRGGDSLRIAAHHRHRVLSTSADARWLCLFLPAG